MSTQTSPSALIPEPPKKIVYIDHLKVVLTVLVVLHHTFITYGAPGGWYYSQKTTHVGAIIPMTMFVAINQAFFMGFFFFLSACFIPSSYRKKGAARFVTDRLIRLGIPLVFYSFVLSPILSYLVYYFAEGHHITYMQYLGGFDGWIDFGVLWFVAALLLFTLIYVLWKLIAGNYRLKPTAVPKTGTIVLAAIATGVVSFLVRTVFPVGWVLKPLGFQLSYFTQYIVLFIVGLIAADNNWLATLADKTGKQMARLVILLVILFPVFYVIKVVMNTPLEWYSGGMHWQSLLYAVWEQLIGFSIITALLSYGKKLWNKPSVLLQNLSRYTFGVYIFHPLVLISTALAFRNLAIDPAIKLLFVAPLVVVCSFLLAAIIVKIPGVKKVI
ncbi:acyltransferase family protein [Mucilaginibacter agri]|uniref:Acyltransferase family protein n=1 Tax=Mucilaginibacter agri TaxID=2695265 RepID=A0A965ZFS4_9SPHI|nr:acyltransferase [Mucilaginibacter agri]NCD70110.1 acyltransferase family protein [Mucilaginibacter agri]